MFLDNRPMGGRSGFLLVTPLRLQGSRQVILVQRGWVPRDFTDRTRVPDVATPPGLVVVEGRLAPPPSQLFELGEAEPGVIRQNIDLPAFAAETGLRLMHGLGAANRACRRRVAARLAAFCGRRGQAPWLCVPVVCHVRGHGGCCTSGFNSFLPAESVAPMAQTPDEPLTLTVHSLPQPR